MAVLNVRWWISVGACLLVCIRDCADTLHRYTLDALINVFVCPECPRCDTTAVLECYLTGTTVLVHDTCENSALCSCRSFWHVCGTLRMVFRTAFKLVALRKQRLSCPSVFIPPTCTKMGAWSSGVRIHPCCALEGSINTCGLEKATFILSKHLLFHSLSHLPVRK